jgi:hypothetical protein
MLASPARGRTASGAVRAVQRLAVLLPFSGQLPSCAVVLTPSAPPRQTAYPPGGGVSFATT